MQTLAAVVLDVVLLAVLFVRVGEEDVTREKTATEEMWARSLDEFRARCDEGRSALTRRDGQRSRIAESAATTNNTHVAQR